MQEPDFEVYLDYFERLARGENPQHLYDGYKGDKSTSKMYVGNQNRIGVEQTKSDLDTEVKQPSSVPGRKPVKRKREPSKKPPKKRSKSKKEGEAVYQPQRDVLWSKP